MKSTSHGGIKMKKHPIVILFLILAFFASGVLAANACDGKGPRGGHRGEGMFHGLKMLHELDLSETQKTDITVIMKSYHDDMQAGMDQVFEAKQSLMDVMHAVEFHEADIRQAFRQVSALKENVMVLRAKMMSEIRGVLTEDQVATLEERKKHRMERMKEHRESKRSGCDSRLENFLE